MSDAELVSALETSAADERQCAARTIAHVAEMDRRKLFRERGYPSMHAYLVEATHLSEAAAFNRIAVGRIAARYPRVLDMIAAGELHLSGAKTLGPVLDAGNVDRLLDAAKHRSKREIQELVAAEAPRPDIPTRMTEVPSEASSSQLFPEPVTQRTPALVSPTRIEPLAPRRYALQVTISEEVHAKLRQAQDLLRHAVPDGDVAQILERGLDLVIARARKRQFAATGTPRPVAPELRDEPAPEPGEEPADRDGAIPAPVRREVAARDGYRCTFVAVLRQAQDARVEGATAWLQFDHIVPRKLGGPSTVSNTRLLCKSHNLLEAERTLGAWVTELPAQRRRRDRANDAAATRQPRDLSTPAEPATFAEAHLALVTLGYRGSEASAALDAVRATVDSDAPLEEVIRAALGAVVIDRGRSRGPIGRRPRRDGGTTCREPRPGWSRDLSKRRLDVLRGQEAGD